MKICLTFTHIQAIWDIDEFVVHWNKFGEIYDYITWSLMDPLQWMGTVRIRVQTADENITIIHTTPVHQLTSCEAKKLHVCKKS